MNDHAVGKCETDIQEAREWPHLHNSTEERNKLAKRDHARPILQLELLEGAVTPLELDTRLR